MHQYKTPHEKFMFWNGFVKGLLCGTIILIIIIVLMRL